MEAVRAWLAKHALSVWFPLALVLLAGGFQMSPVHNWLPAFTLWALAAVVGIGIPVYIYWPRIWLRIRSAVIAGLLAVTWATGLLILLLSPYSILPWFPFAVWQNTGVGLVTVSTVLTVLLLVGETRKTFVKDLTGEVRPTGDLQARLLQTKQDAADVLMHLQVEGRDSTSLSVLWAEPGCPVLYPIRIRNTRPRVVNIVAYSLVVLWDRELLLPLISWRTPDQAATNGLPTPRTHAIPADGTYTLKIPIHAGRASRFPTQSPKWGIKGDVTFQCSDQEDKRTFNFESENYELSIEDWIKLGSKVRPSGEGTSPAFR